MPVPVEELFGTATYSQCTRAYITCIRIAPGVEAQASDAMAYYAPAAPLAHVVTTRERERSVLGALHPKDAADIVASTERVWLVGGSTVAAVGEPLETVWFPEDVIVSLAESQADGQFADIGLIGAEGLVGWQVLLGERRVAMRCTVELAGGHALMMPAARLLALAAERPALRQALFGFVSGFNAQVGRTLASALHGSPAVRLARWLLLYHDRLDGDVLAITHQRLADLLSVRRASVTDWLHVLEGERVIRCTRGRITVRDRDGLERVAGLAYPGIVRANGVAVG